MKSLLTLLFFTSTLSFAQFSFNTGDATLDANLNDINVTAKADLGAFKVELSTEFNVEKPRLEELFSLNIEPAEIYFSLEMGKIINKPAEDILKVRMADHDKGWGVIAKEMGIKPGSAEFHALKDKTKLKKDKGQGKGNSNSSNKGGNGKGNGKK